MVMVEGRPKLTLEALVQKDLGLLDIIKHNALDRAQCRQRIHVADHWDLRLGLVLLVPVIQ